MSSIAWVMFLLFLPACFGLLGQVWEGDQLSSRVLAIAILLLCVDQARMAVVDLEQIAQVKQQTSDSRLARFSQVTLSTIILELCGFYTAAVWLGWGALIILLSQVWFNLGAGIQLHPGQKVTIQAWGIPERLPVLLADGIGLVLVGLWMTPMAPLAIATGLLGLVMVYGMMKYGFLVSLVGAASRANSVKLKSIRDRLPN